MDVSSRAANYIINKKHERAQRLMLIDPRSYFETLSQDDNDICNHLRNML